MYEAERKAYATNENAIQVAFKGGLIDVAPNCNFFLYCVSETVDMPYSECGKYSLRVRNVNCLRYAIKKAKYTKIRVCFRGSRD